MIKNQRCERCGVETPSTIVSMFNLQEICRPCKEIERAHPLYEQACRAERAEILDKQNHHFEGIGLPEDLQHPKKEE